MVISGITAFDESLIGQFGWARGDLKLRDLITMVGTGLAAPFIGVRHRPLRRARAARRGKSDAGRRLPRLRAGQHARTRLPDPSGVRGGAGGERRQRRGDHGFGVVRPSSRRGDRTGAGRHQCGWRAVSAADHGADRAIRLARGLPVDGAGTDAGAAGGDLPGALAAAMGRVAARRRQRGQRRAGAWRSVRSDLADGFAHDEFLGTGAGRGPELLLHARRDFEPAPAPDGPGRRSGCGQPRFRVDDVDGAGRQVPVRTAGRSDQPARGAAGEPCGHARRRRFCWPVWTRI